MKQIVLFVTLLVMFTSMTAQNSAVFQSTFMSNKAKEDQTYPTKWGFDSVFIIEQGKITHVMDHGNAEFYIYMTVVTANGSKVYQTVDNNNQTVTIYFDRQDPYGIEELYYITIDYSKAESKRLRPKKDYIVSKFWVHRD